MKKTLFKKFMAVCLAVILAAVPVSVASASNFNDIANVAWAADAIATVSQLGIMTGDAAGNFNPNGSIDMFEMTRILARMLGFNPATQSISDRAYHEAVFETRRPLIESFDNNFNLWNTQVNREIAFLLYAGVLIPSNLNNFVVLHNGVEARRVVNREEVAVFLVRLMNRGSEAMQTFGVPLFNDHALISPAARVYVYYLRSIGILNGSDGNVSPRSPITRAAMAVLAQSTLQEINSPLLANNTNSNNNNNTNNTGVVALSGTIANTFSAFRSILVVSNVAEHNNRIFTVAQGAIITIGGLNSTFADLTANTPFTAILSGNEIVSINIAGVANGAGTPSTSNTLPEIEDMRLLDGTVARVNAPNRTIGIETRTINPRGEIVSEIRDYIIPVGTNVTRNNVTINLQNINVGDLVLARVHEGYAHKIELEERITQMSGILIEKNFGANPLFPSLVVEDVNGVRRIFTTNSSTIISRGNLINLGPRQIRTGDMIDITADHGLATQIRAHAVGRPSRDVYIRDIFISSRGQSFIVVTDNLDPQTPDTTHLLVDGQVDPFDLTIGSRVRLWFDSNEVTGVVTLQQASATNFTGHIQSLTNAQLVVRDANFQTRTFTLDSNTVFVNSVTGQIVNIAHLQIGHRVQVVSAANQTNRAVSVTILIN